jgi:4-alpha-glucanotransferase
MLVPLFSIRSPDDFGRGEIGGLGGLGRLALAMGQRLIQLLPIDETLPGEASPYSAMSVLAIDPSYISAGELPGIDAKACAAARVEAVKAPLDFARLRTIKDRLLEEAFRYFKAHSAADERTAFAAFTATNRGWLDDYALFRALKEKFGGAEWARWPRELSRHESSAIAEASAELSARVEFFKFVQFVAVRQWRSARDGLAARGVFLGGDLAFLPARESVEVWAHQEMFDLTRAVGAPPDAFSADGQRWDLPMPNWAAMHAQGFALLRLRVRAARELYDFLRIDHVVGLFRTYGYAVGEETTGAFDPASEEAQRAQGEKILRVILEEAGPMRIIAEDLGVIPPFVRETLARLDLPGYKIARWERDWSAPDQPLRSPVSYPRASLATTGTHDTDTLAEWWEGIDDAERISFIHGLGIEDGAAPDVFDDRLRECIIEAIYASPSRLAIFPIQDLFGWNDRINVPGTISADNWSWRMPFAAGSAIDDPKLRVTITRLRAIAERTGRFAPLISLSQPV